MSDAPRGALQPSELATAAVLGGLTVALTIFGWFVPYASAVGVLGVVPMAITGYRCRIRAVIASAVATGGITFLLAGTGPLVGVATCAVSGALVGVARRRSWGVLRLFLLAIGVASPVFSLLADGVLAALPSLRKLALEQIRNGLRGLTNLVVHVLRAVNLRSVGHLATRADHYIDVAIRYWWLTIPIFVSVGVVALTLLTWYLSSGILRRLAELPPPDLVGEADQPGTGPPEPVPVALSAVSYRYDGASSDALHDINLRVEPAQLLTVVGRNGSGKSTLVRLLAGRTPTSGSLTRPGPVGLGRLAGTALVAQRPESQVLGIRVADDVVWGLPVGTDVDVPGLLDAVGLKGMEDRDTSTLSGGELQRLAVAAALAHRPRLLLSDESTAMVDAAGRAALTGLLADLPATRGVSVVHVTHRVEEATAADAVVRLERGNIVPASRAVGLASDPADGDDFGLDRSGGRWTPARVLAAHQAREAIRAWSRHSASATPGFPVLKVVGASHTYAEGTPWAHPALSDIDLEVREGEGVLVVGGNGSGKSTLAWVMAGLIRPTDGECLLDGQPVEPSLGRVGLAFQHSRLQLQRATVRADVRNAAGVDADAADAALALVGLDPSEMGDRSTDRLSGGQMRRVALAGILARRPRVLILDEPMAGLDGPSRQALCRLLADLRVRAGLTVIVISHDLEGMEVVCDRMVELREGRVVADRPLHPETAVPVAAVPVTGPVAPVAPVAVPTTWGSDAARTPGPATSEAPASPARPRRRRARSFVLLRRVGSDSPVHRLWAGTKLLAVAALSLTVSIRPAWSTTALVAAAVVGSALLARIPARAVPRLPWAFWAFVVVGAMFTLLSGGKPYVTVGGTRVGLGGVESYALFTLLSIVLFGASLMIGWTTPSADVAPALVRLGRPFRLLRLPVDEWAVTMALAVRSLPLLIDELRTLIAARRLRPRFVDKDGKGDRTVDLVELCAAALVVALRRSDEMGVAIRVRGGTTNFAAGAGSPRRADVFALLIVAAICAVAFVIPT
ncbi:MAG: ATP-binding cassette domain-containing protein [Acidimicrobiaceae bacterium]|nr:ATP-binding cassette domain-containing protein [Acidimicrobiaceae bacterium]